MTDPTTDPTEPVEPADPDEATVADGPEGATEPAGPPAVEPWPEGPPPGEGLIKLDVVTTAVFTVLSVAAGVWAHPLTAYPAAIVGGALGLAGCVAFGAGYLRGIGRSRHEEIELLGLVWLKGSAPPAARRPLIGLLWVQVVVGLVVAAVHPFTVLAFCVLCPMWGLGLATLWAARHGRFPERRPGPRRAGGARG